MNDKESAASMQHFRVEGHLEFNALLLMPKRALVDLRRHISYMCVAFPQ